MIKIVILTISDSCANGDRADESGPAVRKLICELPAEVIAYEIISDDLNLIRDKLCFYADNLNADLVLTCGGTGLSARDFTAQATRSVIEKEAPGIPELIRAEGVKKTRRAALSCLVAGVRGKTLIINLPGSIKGATESLEAVIDILPHARDMIAGKGH
ncbi:MAG: molybdenum cofactor biosynthesis protein [Candidatus Omnitrophica bacterium CG11_big_fil_rev_8_21_14_0_20_42_13]|uniref:Molybdenum cofactor biosynthesis protein n=1 Tax=Candidatus Ghiorseimicrobium undicola TaxID=1974746 RepID=A0A2H0LXQ3_9BACT|nr:MAG: molybdenum cofactor biosynthesis protein [Candidatus Omnitrophica bacterium CG11_big_fil_rev_8_21_14_0_20_42_13]